jgi:hypothetical protein
LPAKYLNFSVCRPVFHQRAVLPLSDFELLLGRLLHGQTQAQAQGQAAALASSYYPASLVAMPVQVWRALADRLFVAFDRQQRGGVDFEDFVAGMTTLCKGTLEQKAACACLRRPGCLVAGIHSVFPLRSRVQAV